MDNMEKYTIREFMSRHGLTLSQCKLSACRKQFDAELIHDCSSKHGGAKRYYLIIETEKTLSRVNVLKNNNRVRRGDKPAGYLPLSNGMDVIKSCLGLTMFDGDRIISSKRAIRPKADVNRWQSSFQDSF